MDGIGNNGCSTLQKGNEQRTYLEFLLHYSWLLRNQLEELDVAVAALLLRQPQLLLSFSSGKDSSWPDCSAVDAPTVADADHGKATNATPPPTWLVASWAFYLAQTCSLPLQLVTRRTNNSVVGINGIVQ
jgi:hypothetical protein